MLKRRNAEKLKMVLAAAAGESGERRTATPYPGGSGITDYEQDYDYEDVIGDAMR